MRNAEWKWEVTRQDADHSIPHSPFRIPHLTWAAQDSNL